MDAIVIRTEHCPDGAQPFLEDYWLAWANGVQSDGETEAEAIDNAKKALALSLGAEKSRQFMTIIESTQEISVLLDAKGTS